MLTLHCDVMHANLKFTKKSDFGFLWLIVDANVNVQYTSSILIIASSAMN